MHVVAGLEAAHGGPSYSVPRLCEALAAACAKPVLLSVSPAPNPQNDELRGSHWHYQFAQDHVGIPILRDLRVSSGLTQALMNAAAGADVIHDHGIWLMPNVMAGTIASRTGKPLVVSPRGMLAPAALAFSRLKKRVFWALLQGPAIRGAACFHATSVQEYEEIRAFGLTNPVAIIPNGIDLPDPPPPRPTPPGAERIALSLGRIHPKKGLDCLIRAWAMVEAAHPNWRLEIVGPAQAGHDLELRALATRLGLTRVSIAGPLYGDAKTAAYRKADVFVLPSLNESFGLTVAESLAAGTATIATKGTPWRALETEGCGWWIDHGVEAFAAALARAMVLPRDVLTAMGERGRAWMARDFSWTRTARDMLEVYRWLIDAAVVPPLVRFD